MLAMRSPLSICIKRHLVISNNLTKRYQTTWRSHTSTLPTIHDSIQECASSLSSNTSPDLVIACISSTYTHNTKEYSRIPEFINKYFHSPKNILGVVSDAILTQTPSKTLIPSHGISISTISTKSLITPFHISSDSLRHTKTKRVGRWPSYIGKNYSGPMGTSSHPEKHVSEFSWEGFESVSKGAYRNVLPDSLKSLVEAGKQDTVNGLIMFSDPEPYEFLEALDRNFENAFKFGLISAFTPFITGTPHTMFLNNAIHTSGVIGIALSNSPQSNIKTTYNHVLPLGSKLQIGSCRGNVILELSSGDNATRTLLKNLNASGTKNQIGELFLRIWDEDSDNGVMYKVTSGDPSKGTIAVDTNRDLRVGQWIQFWRDDPGVKGDVGEMDGGVMALGTIASDARISMDNTASSSSGASPLGAASSLGVFVGQPQSPHSAVVAVPWALSNLTANNK